ncbi:MAG: hypothetical protein JRF29_13445, partial [Deltaproteobacteria bacterium]|nr:hypothetical protein [Deltaproteobacteria bacterium]
MKAELEKFSEKSGIIFETLSDRFLNWWFSRWPKKFNDWARTIDRKLNRIQPDTGHPHSVALLGMASLLIIMIGPTASLPASFVFGRWPGDFLVERIIGLIVAAAGILFLGWAPRKWKGKQLHTIQCAVLMLIGLPVFLLPDKYTEASGAPFAHIYALVIFVLMFLTMVARWLSHYVMKTMLAADKPNGASGDNENEREIKANAR